jgi:hypothetical protein
MSNDPAGWQNFYIMAGGAAAALTGLIFLALSMQAKAIMAARLYRDRAFASIQSLISQLFLSGAVLVPAQPKVALGLEIEVIAAYFLARSVWAAGWLHAEDTLRNRGVLIWVVEWTAWLIWLGVIITSGLTLVVGVGGGLYLLALAMLYMFASNVWNAWVLIAEVNKDSPGP